VRFTQWRKLVTLGIFASFNVLKYNVSRAGSAPIVRIASRTCKYRFIDIINTNYSEISEHVMFHIHFKNMSLNISCMISIKSSTRFVLKNVNNSVVTYVLEAILRNGADPISEMQ